MNAIMLFGGAPLSLVEISMVFMAYINNPIQDMIVYPCPELTAR